MTRSILRRIRRATLGALCVSVAVGLQAQQPATIRPGTPEQAQTTGTAAITGVVTDATASRPIGGATVTLEERRPGQRSQFYMQVTTPTGRFAFLDLPASDRYFVAAAKPGDHVLVMSNGGFGGVHDKLLAQLPQA